MSAAHVESAPANAGEQRASFFRQSGWLMIANIAGGIMMLGVHFLSKRLGPGEYGTFVAMLSVVMCIPAIPLQMMMAQQTAKAIATGRERELAGIIRLVWLGSLALWVVGALAVVTQQGVIMQRWGLASPLGLWLMLAACLFSAWFPLFCGVLQGQQNFLWLGWVLMMNGTGRVALAAFAIFLIAANAAGLLAGVVLGVALAFGISVWQTRGLWCRAAAAFDWRDFLRQVVPLLLGFTAFQFLFTGDTLFVKSYFSQAQTDAYGAAGTMSRALMWLVGPLAAVMFPRLVHSAVKSEGSNLMGTVLLGTLILSAGGTFSLWLLGPFLTKIIFPASYAMVTAGLLPWYAGAMIPLSLANVLLNNLIARGSFRVVPVLVILALSYGFALTRFHGSTVTVLKVLGCFNLLMLAACAWASRRNASPTTSSATA